MSACCYPAPSCPAGIVVKSKIIQRLFLCPSSRNLSNNKLRDVRDGAFDGAAGVLELLLTGNKLTGLQGRMFRGLSGLKTL